MMGKVKKKQQETTKSVSFLICDGGSRFRVFIKLKTMVFGVQWHLHH